MPGNKKGSEKALKTQLEKYGSREALSAEMSRRAKMRKTVGGGFRDNPELAKRAREKRREYEQKDRPRRRTDVRQEGPTTDSKTSDAQS